LGISAPPVAVDSTNVYFVVCNTLMRVPLRGGPETTLLKLPTSPNLALQEIELVLTATTVILHLPDTVQGDGNNDEILGVSFQGGTAQTLATSSGRIFGFGADSTEVYFVDAAGTHALPLGGGLARLLTDQFNDSNWGSFFGERVSVIGSNLVVPAKASSDAGSDQGAIWAIPLQGGAPQTLATGQPNPAFPMPCGSDICWWTGATPAGVAGTGGPGAIERLDASGNLSALPDAPFFPWSLAFDGNDFFETIGCDACDGNLVRIPADGSAAVPMGPGTYVAVDDSCAYWSTTRGIFSSLKSYPAPAGQ
jgi:hypothetical protein